jgi:hypothetical protein
MSCCLILSSLYLDNLTSTAFFNPTIPANMKSIIALLVTVCVASAASLGPRDSSAESLAPRNFLAVCNAKRGESCAGSGQRACENNGGHSVRYYSPRLHSAANISPSRCCVSPRRRASSTGSTPTTARTRMRIVTAPMASASPTKLRTALAYWCE